CTLEESESPASAAAAAEDRQPAVRLGLCLIKGLAADAAERLTQARTIKPFENIDDLTRRADLSSQDLQALARANALSSLLGHRRQAAWQVAGITAMPKLLKDAPIAEDALLLPQASEGQEILADYASL